MTENSYITALLLQSGDLYKTCPKTLPRFEIDTTDKDLTDSERKKVILFVDRCRFDTIHIGINFKANLGIITPCIGYYAKADAKTYFQMECIHSGIFRGIMMMNLPFKHAYLDDQLRDFLSLVNLHLRDQGNFSWMGLYERNRIINGSKYVLVVVCGLSNDEYNQFYIKCAECTNRLTLNSCVPLFDEYRQIAKNRRLFVMGTMYKLLNSIGSISTVAPPAFKKIHSDATMDNYDKMKSICRGIVYPWTRIPSRPVLLNPEIPHEFLGAPVGSIAVQKKDPELLANVDQIVDYIDVVLDDYCAFDNSTMIRLSGHVISSTTRVNPIVYGPCDSIGIITEIGDGVIYAAQAYTMKSTNANNSEARIVTHEDPLITEPLLLYSTYNIPQREDIVQRLTPLCVRYSVRDDVGFSKHYDKLVLSTKFGIDNFKLIE